MLLIISDLHLSDNSLSPTVDPGLFRLLREQLVQLATKASWRSDDIYRPIDCIDIVLLGDILDLIQTNYWLEHDVRPWRAANSESAAKDSRQLLDAVSNIVDRVLLANEKSAGTLRAMSRMPSIRVPNVDASGRPAAGAGGHAIPVRVHYMVGDRDWPLCIPGPGFDLIRQKIIQHFGLSNRFDQPFPHAAQDCEMLQRILDMHHVHAMHGDAVDPVSYSGDRSQSSLSDVLAIEVLQRYVLESIQSAGKGIPELLANGLRQALQIHPISAAAEYIDQILRDSVSSRALLAKFRANWNQLVDAALQSDIPPGARRDEEQGDEEQGDADHRDAELLSGIARSLRIDGQAQSGRRASINSLPTIASLSAKLLQATANDPALNDPNIRHVVYGHSHRSESYAVRSTRKGRSSSEQLYFNTGSWQPAHHVASSPDVGVTRPLQQVAFHFFYKEDERGGRSFEVWQGMLDTGNRIARPDVSRKTTSSMRAVRSLAKASVLARPHFLDANAGSVKATGAQPSSLYQD